MNKSLGIGLIGYGGIGRLHALCYRMLPLVYPELGPIHVVGVVAKSPATIARANRELGNIIATTDLDTLLDHPEVTLIDCCAPTDDHYAISTATLTANKALYCEKPLTANQAQSEELRLLAEQTGMTVGVHYHFRAIPALQEARRRIEQGLLGEVIGFQMRYYRASNLRTDRPLSWRFLGPSSGVLIDLGSHLIDMTQHLLGPISQVAAFPRTIHAQRRNHSGALVAISADDDVRLEVELAQGGRGTLVASKVVAGAGDDLRIEAYGTQGSLIFDTTQPNGIQIASATSGSQWVNMQSRATLQATLPGSETPTATLHWHLTAIAEFIEAWRHGHVPPTDLRAALQTDRVIHAAQQSALSDNRTIPIT
jgi:predicted dehydrogenase